MRKWISLAAGLALPAIFFATATSAETEQAGTLKVVVSDVRASHGHLHVAICPQPLFLKDNCPYKAIVAVQQGVTEVVMTGIPAGTYSAQAFLDENDNDKLDRTLIGVPEEGVGFSRDPSYTFGPPDFNETDFQFDGVSGEITFRLRYY